MSTWHSICHKTYHEQGEESTLRLNIHKWREPKTTFRNIQTATVSCLTFSQLRNHCFKLAGSFSFPKVKLRAQRTLPFRYIDSWVTLYKLLFLFSFFLFSGIRLWFEHAWIFFSYVITCHQVAYSSWKKTQARV